MRPLATQIATLERLANCQNNLAIPLTNDERDDVHALIRWLRELERQK